jgi:hypothetical protein
LVVVTVSGTVTPAPTEASCTVPGADTEIVGEVAARSAPVTGELLAVPLGEIRLSAIWNVSPGITKFAFK